MNFFGACSAELSPLIPNGFIVQSKKKLSAGLKPQHKIAVGQTWTPLNDHLAKRPQARTIVDLQTIVKTSGSYIMIVFTLPPNSISYWVFQEKFQNWITKTHAKRTR